MTTWAQIVDNWRFRAASVFHSLFMHRQYTPFTVFASAQIIPSFMALQSYPTFMSMLTTTTSLDKQ